MNAGDKTKMSTYVLKFKQSLLFQKLSENIRHFHSYPASVRSHTTFQKQTSFWTQGHEFSYPYLLFTMIPAITLTLTDLTQNGSVRKRSRRDIIMSTYLSEKDPEFA
jgi:hypothetical protein